MKGKGKKETLTFSVFSSYFLFSLYHPRKSGVISLDFISSLLCGKAGSSGGRKEPSPPPTPANSTHKGSPAAFSSAFRVFIDSRRAIRKGKQTELEPKKNFPESPSLERGSSRKNNVWNHPTSKSWIIGNENETLKICWLIARVFLVYGENKECRIPLLPSSMGIRMNPEMSWSHANLLSCAKVYSGQCQINLN